MNMTHTVHVPTLVDYAKSIITVHYSTLQVTCSTVSEFTHYINFIIFHQAILLLLPIAVLCKAELI